MFSFESLTSWIHSGLAEHLPPFAVVVVEGTLVGICLLSLYAVLGIILIYAERKFCAFIQCRLGPNRVGPMGIFQTVADTVKLLSKELIHINKADATLFNIAPFLVILGSLLTFAALPFAKGLHAVDLNIGVLYVIAASSLGVLGILIGGWASNNKYALIGAMRSGAQMVSYELSIGLSMITMVVLSGSLQLSTIVEAQADGWFLFKGHIPAFIAFITFLISSTAEINRGPFDLAEAESELTAGFHTEYSGMKFAFFFLAEFLNMFIVAGIASTIFLGGWMPLHIPGWEGFNTAMDYIPSALWFFGKAFFVVAIIMWFKWTFPRLRIDQLLTLEWKYLMPINVFNLILMAIVVLMGWHF